MKIIKKVGIFMDHRAANIIPISENSNQLKTIESKFTHQQKEVSVGKSEQLMHNKEQHLQAAYYKQLGETIKHFDHVLLCGPTDAKLELNNILKGEQHYSKIKIVVKDADKMSENEQKAFVKDYFTNCV